MNIYNVNKRQFEAVMKREKITVMDYYDNDKSYEVFFRRSNRSNSPQGKVRLYYSQDTGVNAGTVFVMKDSAYLVISRDADESDIYYTSIAVKCDASFTVYSSKKERYVIIPFVATSDKYTVTHGSTISIISGSVVVYTGLNDYVREMRINDLYYNFGGYYKLGNYFYNNNIAYIYLERELDRVDTYSLIYDGATSLSLEDGIYQLSYTAIKNGNMDFNPSIAYEVSDNAVATVSSSGLLTINFQGNVTVTATWLEGKNTVCQSVISITDKNNSDTNGTAAITGNTSLKNGYARTYTAHFYDAAGSKVTDVSATWSITDCTFATQTVYTSRSPTRYF